MTISVKVSVNGNYKVPVTVAQGERQETIWISGYGHNGPNEVNINYSHNGDAMTLNIGPEEQDYGAPAEDGQAGDVETANSVEETDNDTQADA